MSHMTCKSGWYDIIFYPNETYSSLVPSNLIGCQTTWTKETYQKSELLEVTMLIGMVFLLFIMYRSCSRNKMDWYRLIAVYIVGSIGVLVSLRLGPHYGGFNKVLGFGIVVHNTAEIIMLGHIWFGDVNQKRSTNTFGAVWVGMYIWFITALIVFLQDAALFYVLMLQGAFCDWALVGSFLRLGYWMDHDGAGGGEVHRKTMGCYGGLATAAAILHILSIQPLFVGIAASWAALNAYTVVLLVPTFILYIWFSVADKAHRPIVLQPKMSAELVLDAQRNRLLKRMIQPVVSNGDSELKQRHQGRADADEIELEEPLLRPSENHPDPLADAIMESVEKMEAEAAQDEEDKKVTTYRDIIRIGLLSKDVNGKKWAIIIALSAFLVDAINVTLVFFLPCLYDFCPQVCDPQVCGN